MCSLVVCGVWRAFVRVLVVVVAVLCASAHRRALAWMLGAWGRFRCRICVRRWQVGAGEELSSSLPVEVRHHRVVVWRKFGATLRLSEAAAGCAMSADACGSASVCGWCSPRSSGWLRRPLHGLYLSRPRFHLFDMVEVGQKEWGGSGSATSRWQHLASCALESWWMGWGGVALRTDVWG